MRLAPLVVITREMVASLLRRDLPAVMLAAVFLVLAIAVLVLFFLRRRHRDRALLWLSIFALLYGVRLLVTTDIWSDAFDFERLWMYFDSLITYCICLPVFLVLWEIFPAWRRVLRYVLGFLLAFALVGCLSDLVLQRPRSLFTLNNILVLLSLAALLVLLFRNRHGSTEVRTLSLGVLLFCLTAAANNIVALTKPGLMFNFEPLGLLALLIALGLIVARRTITRDERLVEIEKELTIARQIQASILPREMPAGQYWDIAARYIPMTAVAGDFYDFASIDENRLGILIADVTGHGVPAALIASMVKVAFAAQLPHADRPGEVLSGINRALCGNLQGQFVTAAYLYLDLSERSVRYSAAGHPALFRFRDGTVEEIIENGLMLGLFAHASYGERQLDLEIGDRFLLYTDGLLEAESAEGEFFGAARAKQILYQTHREGASQVVEKLYDSIAQWATAQQDDLTLIAVACRQAS